MIPLYIKLDFSGERDNSMPIRVVGGVAPEGRDAAFTVAVRC
jgi:hypothetical protein